MSFNNHDQLCNVCKSVCIENFHKLPFNGVICNQCLDSQCQHELNEYNKQHGKYMNQQPHEYRKSQSSKSPTPVETTIGINLFNSKQALDQFNADLKNYKSKINEKIEAVKLVVNVNFNYCKHKIDSQKAAELRQLDVYNNDAVARVDINKLNEIKDQVSQYEEFFKKQSNQNNSSTLEKYTNLLQKQLKQANQVIFNNTSYSYKILSRKHVDLNNLGYLKFIDIEDPASTSSNTDTTDLINSSPYFNLANNKPSILLHVLSLHILDENMIIVCREETTKLTRIKVFNLVNSKLKFDITLPGHQKLIKACSDLCYFLTVEATTDGLQEIILYDQNLTKLECAKFEDTGRLIDVFLNRHLFILYMQDDGLKLKKYGPDLKEISSLSLTNIQQIKKSSQYKLCVINNKLFLSQKFLFGTRLNMIDISNGGLIWKIDICYFFDTFYVDLSRQRVLFFCNGKFFSYDMQLAKVVVKMGCQNLDKAVCVFDYNRNGEIYAMIPY